MRTSSASPDTASRQRFLPVALSASLAAAGLIGAVGALTPTPAHAAVPTITTFACPLDNGGGRFYCFVDYTSSTAATVTWSAYGTVNNDPGHSDFYGHCAINDYFTVTVTITNASGSVSRTSIRARCKGGPIIL